MLRYNISLLTKFWRSSTLHTQFQLKTFGQPLRFSVARTRAHFEFKIWIEICDSLVTRSTGLKAVPRIWKTMTTSKISTPSLDLTQPTTSWTTMFKIKTFFTRTASSLHLKNSKSFSASSPTMTRLRNTIFGTFRKSFVRSSTVGLPCHSYELVTLCTSTRESIVVTTSPGLSDISSAPSTLRTLDLMILLPSFY